MRLRWTAPAAQDLYSITRYIHRDNSTAAREVAKTLYEGCESLISHPHRVFILDHLDYATTLDDLAGVKDFHELKGDRKETYSMHVNGNYVITFGWNGNNIINVNFEDYHGK